MIQHSNTNDELTIELSSVEAETAKLEVFDLNGNLLGSMDYQVGSGSNTLRFNLSNLNSGTYMYMLTIDNKFKNTDKFIIAR